MAHFHIGRPVRKPGDGVAFEEAASGEEGRRRESRPGPRARERDLGRVASHCEP